MSIAIKLAMQSREQSQEILIEFDENTNANEQAERVIEKTERPLAGLWTGFAVFKINEAKRMTEATDGRAIAVRTYKAKPAKAFAKSLKKQNAQRAPSSRNPASKLRIGRRAAR
jgi:hypothetical protein